MSGTAPSGDAPTCGFFWPWFHPGELEVQKRAGVEDRAARLLGMFDTEVPPVAAEFLAAQPWIVLGAADADERMWATVLYGTPGLHHDAACRTSCTSPRVRCRVIRCPTPCAPPPRSAAWRWSRAPGAGCASTATRCPSPDGLEIALEQVYSNCPKYIATRRPVEWREATPARVAGTSLDARAQALLAAADTAFVATRAPGTASTRRTAAATRASCG